MNERPSAPPGAKSPFAHRATRNLQDEPAPAQEAQIVELAASSPRSFPRGEPVPGRKISPVFFVAGAVFLAAAGVAAYLLSGDKANVTSRRPASGPAPTPLADDGSDAARSRSESALALARRYGCDKDSPVAFAAVLMKAAEAASASPSSAKKAWSEVASGAASLAYFAAVKTRAGALAAPGVEGLLPLSGASRLAMETDSKGADVAFAAGDALRAAELADRAVSMAASCVSEAKLRAGALAGEAESRGDPASARVFYRKLAKIGDGVASSWLMRRGYVSGTPVLSPKLGIPLAYVAPGAFTQGSPEAEPGRDADEIRRDVTLARGVWFGVTEVTQGQWDAVMGRGAAAAKLTREKRAFVGENLPMVNVTWAESAEYCRRLSTIEGVKFRLPTEAEWEYAARAGTGSAYATGKSFLAPGEAVVDDATANAPDSPHAVSASTALVNAWGLRDMHGNVWEWCSDWYAGRSSGAVADPQGPDDRTFARTDTATKVVRGGSWNDPARSARSAKRWQYPPSVAVDYIGFRVVMEFSPAVLPE